MIQKTIKILRNEICSKAPKKVCDKHDRCLPY